MKPFVVNSHDRLVFPANFISELDFSVIDDLEQFTAIVERDFEAKAPTGTDILDRVTSEAYSSRYELLRDMAQNLFWVNRFSMTMFEKRPTRWRDLPRHRPDVFLPVLTPWEDGDKKVRAVREAFGRLAPTWDEAEEQRVFDLLFDVFGHRRHHATELPAVKPTVAQFLETPGAMTFVVPGHDPDFPVFGQNEIWDVHADVPELEALTRWAMVLHNQYPWDRAATELRTVDRIGDDDHVVAFHPRNRDVEAFLDRVTGDRPPRKRRISTPAEPVEPVRPLPPVRVPEAFRVQPRIESIAIARGEHVCSNEDVVRNSAFSWSPMSAASISKKTGIDQRRYTSYDIEDLAYAAAVGALEKAGRGPDEIGAVLVATCTSERLIPSLSTWLSGQLGILQTHCSADIVAACAGLPYGLSEAVRQLQEVDRPVLLVCVEKFSDKIGNVRTSRMIFGDGAAALVVAPAPEGEAGDVEVLQTYASGPRSQVNSIIWPNPEFDNDITVYGPEVKALVARYLDQMLGELREQPAPDGTEGAGSLLEAIDLIVPHQANKTMILQLAADAGLSEDQLYFNIETMGNVSAASIPIAMFDAVASGAVTAPARVFAPGFGAGAVGGYAVLRLDPAVLAPEVFLDRHVPEPPAPAESSSGAAPGASTDDVRIAFGE
jgi:3-oxoacyl-(acyl-carrier-protein) synthase III